MFLPSVAIGCLVTVLPVSYLQLAVEGNASWKSIYERCDVSESFIPAGFAGAVFTVAMGTNIQAIDSLDYATAMVIMQCAIVVAGTWGIVLYDEMKGWSAVKFYLSSSILLCGALLVRSLPACTVYHFVSTSTPHHSSPPSRLELTAQQNEQLCCL